jgi:SAM-dependent methyltransferase
LNPDEYGRMFDLEDHYWWFVGRRLLALRLLRKYLKPGAGKPAVLDIGCGTGVVSRELSAWCDVVSLDMSSLALGYCKQRGLGRLVQGDGQRLPLKTDSFDAVIGLDIYEHIEEDELSFRETLRVLKPGGIVVLSVPAFKSLWGPHDIALMHHRRYRRVELADKLRRAGFGLLRVGYSVFFLFPAVVIVRMFEKRRKGPAKANLVPVSPLVNAGLIGLQRLEAALISQVSLPWGSTVVAVARKPEEAQKES